MVSQRRPSTLRRKAMVIKVAVIVLIGAVGALAPLPRIVEEQAMATETRRPFAGQPIPSESTTSTAAPGSDVTATTSSTATDDAAEPSQESTTTLPETAPGEPGPEAVPDDGPRVAADEDTRDFTMIGVTLDAYPDGPVLVRVAGDDEAWGPWEELEFEVDAVLPPVPGAPVPETPDETAPGKHSEPLWVGEAGRYELDLPAGQAAEAQVHLVHETTRKVAVVESESLGADPVRPAINPRSSWGARAPKTTPSVASRFQAAVVHHTAGQNGYSSAQVPAILRSVQAYHMDANGWNDIAYNFAVDRFGRIWEARGGGITRAIIGGHARGFNTGTTGVVVLGNFDSAGAPPAAVSAVARLLAWKFAVHNVDPRTSVAFRAGAGSPRYPPGSVVPMSRIVGHRDIGLTACPGANLYPQLPSIRRVVNNAYPSYAVSGTALVGNFVGHGYDDIFLRQPGVLADQLLGSTGGGFTPVASFSVRDPRYRPRVGDFDGNGYDDILWYGPGRVSDSIWLSRGNGTFRSVTLSVRGVHNPVVGDFDGNGRDDILWYGSGGTRESLWLSRGGGSFRSVYVRQVSPGYVPVAGDFDGDGDDDIFWHGPGGRGDSFWAARGGSFSGRSVPQVRGTYRPVAGDYDGNGTDDIFWYAPGSTPESVWRTTSTLRFIVTRTPSVRGLFAYGRAGNFRGDGRAEMLWYASPGADAMWWHPSSALFGRSSATQPQLR